MSCCGGIEPIDGGSLGTITAINTGRSGYITRLGCCPGVPFTQWTADEWLLDISDIHYGPMSYVFTTSTGDGGGSGSGGPQLGPAGGITPTEPPKLPGDNRTDTGGPTDPGPNDDPGGGGGGHTTNDGSAPYPGGGIFPW